jgi:hypothetical protein
MILSQATNGNTEYEIYDIGNNATSAGYLLGKIGADWQFAGLGGFTAGSNCRPAALMLASAGCGHAVALGYVRELPAARTLSPWPNSVRSAVYPLRPAHARTWRTPA